MRMVTTHYKDEGYFRRQYPRRDYNRKIGVLCGGHYIICDGSELGEGGLSFTSEFVFDIGSLIVVNFQIPSGDFISLRAEVKSHIKRNNQIIHGIAFLNIQFFNKRQIRSFVSKREDIEQLGLYSSELDKTRH